uniref:Ubiquitin carboxyl-terminal hydrolase n=1 Tax=Xenopsylla cheopis TaxID=163159 RepID=A0A6M2DS33_XENCH
MPVYIINVKWGKEQFRDIEVNTDEEPELFKAQLFALTGVQPNRQKIMCKGVALGDTDWGKLPLKNGVTVLLLGTKEELPETPEVKVKFLEDMNEQELATAMKLPSGLHNIGNTCYMNATVQCLKTVPELRRALEQFKEPPSGGLSANITISLRDLYATMNSGAAISPIMLLQTFHLALPRFAEKSNRGDYIQQDANECWTELTRMLQENLPSSNNSNAKSVIDQYFGITFDIEMKCTESELEEPTKSKENVLQLSCFISTEVKYLQLGLKSKMHEQISKFSSSMGRDAIYTKNSFISRLPAYLTIQFVRFNYKSKVAVNAKILKDVKFPIDFDAFELCTPQLQEKLTPMRLKFKAIEDMKVTAEATQESTETSSKADKVRVPFSFEDDPGSNNSGYYTLQAVLTHQGRSSSSGHYVAWIRDEGETWFKCDDEQVTTVTSNDIINLSGGGDWHCAYVLLYGPRILEESQTKAE